MLTICNTLQNTLIYLPHGKGKFYKEPTKVKRGQLLLAR